MEKKHVAILGSTGSIGKQTLDIIRQNKEMFEVELLTANNNSDLLIQQAIEFDVNEVVICNKDKYSEVADALQSLGIKVFVGMDSICDLVSSEYVDIVVSSMVGFSGLKPTIAAIKSGKTIALANKETLVAAGQIIMPLIKEYNAAIIPIDSEHSAIFQCLHSSPYNKFKKIHLTASGGPFRTWSIEDISKATPQMALKHPNWNMGAKISIDSATMMNKGLEIIEAKWLFDCNIDDINVIIHPESIIHSMVEYEDGAIIAQLGPPDMHQPIQYALFYPVRQALNNNKLNFYDLEKLTFHKPDVQKFPALQLAIDSIQKGGNLPCIMNAANEKAVAGFLANKINFYQISDIIAEVMSKAKFIQNPTLDDIYKSNNEALALAEDLLNI